MPERRVVVVGGGLSGCLLAILLGRRGLPVTVYERRPDPRVAGVERGRSINLAISARGLAALQRVGLRDAALARALPMRGRMVHALASAPSFRPYSADGTRAINSISRAELNGALLDCAEATPGVVIRFGQRIASLDEVDADVVLGCDGAYSAVRKSLGVPSTEEFLQHKYKELTIPPRDGDFALDPGALHVWPRGSSMMIALPNLDRSFTCTLFWAASDFEAVSSRVVDHFRDQYLDVVDLMPSLVDDYERNPVGSLVTVRAWPWVRGRVALVGDAAHAIVPFFGQGANCAFEDCIELVDCLDATGSWDAALARYQERRKPNTEAIADMALDNFVEMRDKVNSPLFRAKVAAQHALERRLAGRYVSRYELVSFTTTPYAQIPGRIRKQNLLLAAGVLGVALAAVRSSRWVVRLASSGAVQLATHRRTHHSTGGSGRGRDGSARARLGSGAGLWITPARPGRHPAHSRGGRSRAGGPRRVASTKPSRRLSGTLRRAAAGDAAGYGARWHLRGAAARAVAPGWPTRSGGDDRAARSRDSTADRGQPAPRGPRSAPKPASGRRRPARRRAADVTGPHLV